MSISRETQTELLRLVGKLLDEQLGGQDKTRLAELLLADRAAADYYLSLVAIHTELEWQHEDVPHEGVEATSRADGQTEGVSPPWQAGKPHSVGEPAPQRIFSRQEKRQGKSPRKNQGHTFPVGHPSRARPPRFNLQTALLFLGLAGIATVTIWAISNYRIPTEQAAIPPAAPKNVATLVRCVDARWTAPANLSAGAELQPGQELQLLHGTAEIRFRSGASVVLEGPATFVVGGAFLGVGTSASGNSHTAVAIRASDWKRAESPCHFSAGKLSAHVPQSARGFTIRTPLATVIDFGTRFSLSVGEKSADVSVSEGLVRVESSGDTWSQPAADAAQQPTGASPEPVMLRAGEAVRIVAATRSFVRTSAEDYRRYVLSLGPDIYLPMENDEERRGEREQDRGNRNHPPSIINPKSEIKNLAAPDHSAVLHRGEDLPISAHGERQPLATSPFVLGRAGQALCLRGGQSAEYGQIAFAPPKDHDFTFAAWVWLNHSTAGDRIIMSDYWAHRRSGFGMGVNQDGRLYVAISEMIQKVRSTPLALVETATRFPTESWQHVAAVADKTKPLLTLYRNGVPVASQAATLFVPWKEEPPPMYFGVSAFDVNKPDPPRCWSGKLDEVVVWRRALTADEIKNLYERAPQE